MTKIERRKTTVSLYQGNYQHQLAELEARAEAALIAEQSGASPRRAGTKSEAARLAVEFDALVTEAEASAVKVDLFEISNTEWQKIADEHPPREGDPIDRQRGVNAKTFPTALLKASVDPAAGIDLDELSRLHFVKLANAAWDLHAGDDALPKYSLVSLVKEAREQGSKQQPDSE